MSQTLRLLKHRERTHEATTTVRKQGSILKQNKLLRSEKHLPASPPPQHADLKPDRVEAREVQLPTNSELPKEKRIPQHKSLPDMKILKQQPELSISKKSKAKRERVREQKKSKEREIIGNEEQKEEGKE